MSAGDPVPIKDMPHDEFMKLLRKIGPDIGLLSARGDKFAQAVEKRYRDAHADPLNPIKRTELRIAVQDYMDRDLRIHERTELGSKYGHYVDEEKGPTRIVVPEHLTSGRKQ